MLFKIELKGEFHSEFMSLADAHLLYAFEKKTSCEGMD